MPDPITDLEAAHSLRHARRLIERAMPACAELPSVTAALETCRQLLGQIAGDDRDDDALADAARPPPNLDP